MKNKSKYYSVAADNGFMVANNWDQVKKLRVYFRGDDCKSYKSKEDAIEATREKYNDRHEYVKYYGEIVINKPYFAKDIVQLNNVLASQRQAVITESKVYPSPAPMVCFY